MNTTRERWTALCQKLGAKDNSSTGITISGTFYELYRTYSGSDRHYHNFIHISDGLGPLDEIRHLAEDPDSLEAAWWFHDIIYDTKNSTNEEESAIFANTALQSLGITIAPRVRVVKLIAATKHDHIPDRKDLQLIIDIDLASLAVTPDVFDQNTANIRKEYAWVSDEDFRIGRVKFFQKLLKGRPSIYLTDYFRNKYEAQAQENLKMAMTILDN